MLADIFSLQLWIIFSQTVELLLRKFPELIHTLTVEQWSPLHAACINGHAAIFETILKFPFRRDLRKTVRDKSGESRGYIAKRCH